MKLTLKQTLLDPEDEHYRKDVVFSNGYPALGKTYLHRILLGALPNQTVDHRNGNILDARKTNLRICTQAQNCLNKVKTSAKVTSKYKGVSWRKSHSKWQATIYILGRQFHLGYFSDEHQAAFTYDIAAKKHHKEFAKLNFSLELS